MATLPKGFVIFCFNLCAATYIGIGVYGIILSMGPVLARGMPLWHSAAFGLATILLIEGICYFGQLWDQIMAREAAEARTKKVPKT